MASLMSFIIITIIFAAAAAPSSSSNSSPTEQKREPSELPGIPNKFLNTIERYMCSSDSISHKSCINDNERSIIYDSMKYIIWHAKQANGYNFKSDNNKSPDSWHINQNIFNKIANIISTHPKFAACKVDYDSVGLPFLIKCYSSQSQSQSHIQKYNHIFLNLKAYCIPMILLFILIAITAIIYRNVNFKEICENMKIYFSGSLSHLDVHEDNVVTQSKEYTEKIRNVLYSNSRQPGHHPISKFDLFKIVAPLCDQKNIIHKKGFYCALKYLENDPNIKFISNQLHNSIIEQYEWTEKSIDEDYKTELSQIINSESLNAPSNCLKISNFTDNNHLKTQEWINDFKKSIKQCCNSTKIMFVGLVEKSRGSRAYLKFKTSEDAAKAYFDLKNWNFGGKEKCIKFITEELLEKRLRR
ncbi:MAG: hypothetical protein MHMPM18_002697 [Marteilia pararefringens]